MGPGQNSDAYWLMLTRIESLIRPAIQIPAANMTVVVLTPLMMSSMFVNG